MAVNGREPGPRHTGQEPQRDFCKCPTRTHSCQLLRKIFIHSSPPVVFPCCPLCTLLFFSFLLTYFFYALFGLRNKSAAGQEQKEARPPEAPSSCTVLQHGRLIFHNPTRFTPKHKTTFAYLFQVTFISLYRYIIKNKSKPIYSAQQYTPCDDL